MLYLVFVFQRKYVLILHAVISLVSNYEKINLSCFYFPAHDNRACE
ncbi:conserved protein of unknown function [Legionella micdadei]|uniref:Uncharacterized protein n=1 Tax=Legionella micdadei TaxID=451 RepID=A0A098GAP4_LEGMI|nr:conserved protein of unknown function [Legionella micdadei]